MIEFWVPRPLETILKFYVHIFFKHLCVVGCRYAARSHRDRADEGDSYSGWCVREETINELSKNIGKT